MTTKFNKISQCLKKEKTPASLLNIFEGNTFTNEFHGT